MILTTSWWFGQSMFLTVDVSYCQSMILPFNVLEVDVLVVDDLELDVLGARHQNNKCKKRG
jgi:hypothetical protein